MEEKANHIVFLFFFPLLLPLFLSLSTADPLQTQTLTLHHSLPNPPALSELAQSDPESQTTLSVPLHHVDALSSHKTPQDLFNTRLQRDAARVKSVTSLLQKLTTSPPPNNLTGIGSGSSASSSVISGISLGSGEYFTRLGVGTPPRYLYLVLDTGSDVVWLQCAPCKKCYPQSDPVFDPKKSRTFAGVACSSPLCRNLQPRGCDRRRNACQYLVSYGDGSFTVGDFSTETLTFRRAGVPRVGIGCGHDNEGLFIGAAGLLGLGRGKLSFPAQTGAQFKNKFSYCLVDRSGSSKPSSIVFGDSAVSRTAQFTPLLSNPKLDTFYYVELLGISVGGIPVRGISASLFRLDRTGNGGVIIDSGTSVTRLVRPAYVALRDAFRAGSAQLKPAPEFSLFDTCYDLSGTKEVKVPTIVLHFRGVDVSLPAENYLIPVDNNGSYCLAFAGTMNKLSIIGNIQQQGFRVVFDLAGSRVGFIQRGC